MHQLPDFETKDNLGQTLQASGSVSTSNSFFPAAPQGKIAECLIRNPDTNNITTKLYVSFDGGANFLSLARGEFVGWTPKHNASNQPIQQLVIKGSVAVTYYELLVNIEGN